MARGHFTTIVAGDMHVAREGQAGPVSTLRAARATVRESSAPVVQSRQSARFTLTELTVTLAIIVTIVLLMLPSISDFVTRARLQRALGDCQTLAAAVAQFYDDNGFLPNRSAPTPERAGLGLAPTPIRVLVTAGSRPDEPADATHWLSGATDGVERHLAINGPGYPTPGPTAVGGWRGPYLHADVGPDPWGRQYLINIGADGDRMRTVTGDRTVASWGAVWVLSAGPNGIIETEFNQRSTTAKLGGDDVGVRVR